MSKKNSSVKLKNSFKFFDDSPELYQNFKKKLSNLKNKSIVVAVSGGPDSLALASLCRFYSLEKKLKFHYVLVDHSIRKNSSKEATKVKKLLKTHKINLTILVNKKKINNNIQGTARKIRYDMLSSFCIKKKVKLILTGHNLEDQVETFLIRLSRGSGLVGLSAMKPLLKLKKDIRLYRPLLDTKKNDLIKISKNIFGNYIKDPSNNDNKFLRTKIRNLKKPLKKSGIEYDQIIKSINNLASSRATLDYYFEKTFANITKKLKKDIKINLIKFHGLNEEIKIRTINKSIKLIKKNYYNPRSKKVVALIKNLETKKFKKATLGGCIFIKKGDHLSLSAENK